MCNKEWVYEIMDKKTLRKVQLVQLEIAKEQLRKPFSREDELKQKEARLSELNALLNVDKKENEIVNDDNEIVNDSPQRSEIDRESR